MRTRYRYDKEMECLVEIGGNANYFEEKTTSTAVISDDVGAGVDGLRHMPSGKMLDSKSAHRAETKARGLVEIGTATDFTGQKSAHSSREYGEMAKDARDQIAGDYNGTRGWLEQENRKSRG